eukprot:TRINITY_DN1650_c0_g1_i1.p1 TRINITY_DN1650_c0_g1~~TRINITY_DN1650_c0_g1_i1.p1  ORF type:complete len:394 (+),score=155.21 TRINITY_DN1650_c0_g1_i1:61-1242(+)
MRGHNAARSLATLGRRGQSTAAAELKRTQLHDFHRERGCKFVDFCGWEMPVQYTATGVLKEHSHCRESAALFDVSHMGQWIVRGDKRHEFLERVTVIDTEALTPGTGGLTVITNERGGIIDDTVVCKLEDHVHMVVNAGCQDKDFEHVSKHLPDGVTIERQNYGLLALQGPKAAEVLTMHYGASLGDMPFMAQRNMKLGQFQCRVTRCGYTGEDGFEISVPAAEVAAFAADLCSREQVLPAGLASRDSLRLEAGLCLYGNDIDENTTPIEAGLAWCLSKRRRAAGGFIGADSILPQLSAKAGEEGAYRRKRVGLAVTGPPVRPGAKVLRDGEEVGVVTSGGPSPTLKRNIAMAYVDRRLQKAGTELQVEVRGKRNKAVVEKMPFVPARYFRMA